MILLYCGADLSLLELSLSMRLGRVEISAQALDKRLNRCKQFLEWLVKEALGMDQLPLLPGYGWIFPMGGGVVNVGVGVFLDAGGPKANLRELFHRYVRSCPVTGPAMEGAEPLGPLAGARLRTAFSGACPSGEGVLAAGEAIGMTYSLSGEGIGKAMQSGKLAAEVALEALEAGDVSAAFLARYDSRLEAAFRVLFRQYGLAQKALRHPWMADLVAWKGARSARLRHRLEQIIAEERPPTEVFSLRGAARALLLP